MRDVNRIDTILEQIGGVWKQYPDLRLGQLLLNVLGDPVLYYAEDDDIVKALREFYKVDNNEEVFKI